MWSKNGFNGYGNGLGNYFSQKGRGILVQKSSSDGTGKIVLLSELSAKHQEKSQHTESSPFTDNSITSLPLTVCENCYGICLGSSMASPSAFHLLIIRSTLRLRIGLRYSGCSAMATFIPLVFGMLICRDLELEAADLWKAHLFEPFLALHSTRSEFPTNRLSHRG